eukprot:m.434561 g.434561  ORF g.434561 m.434561 type:complete len:453 (-) comp17732_c0_seq1:103-1461(-)
MDGWWAELEAEEAGGAAPVVDEPEIKGDICNDGSILKEITKSGEAGPMPKTGSKVKCHYVGTLLDGTKFDSSRDRNTPFEFTIGQGVITGWSEGVATMRKGEIADFTIASHKAYGESGSGAKIPPNATLKFEIELLSWADAGMADVSKDKDGGVMKEVLKEATKDKWKKANTMSTVVANVKMKVKGGPVVIDTTVPGTDPLSFVVGDHAVIRGLEEAVMSMAAGEVAKFEIAPQYGFAAAKGDGRKDSVVGLVELLSFEKDAQSWELKPEEKAEQASARKEEGNKLFKDGEYERAMLRYGSAIDKFGNNNEVKSEEERALLVPCHLNKAMCQLKLKRPSAALETLEKVLKLDKANVKGLYRKGLALADMGEYDDAKAALKECLSLDPKNGPARKKFEEIKATIAKETKQQRAKFAGMFDKFAKEEAKAEAAEPAAKEAEPAATEEGDAAAGN